MKINRLTAIICAAAIALSSIAASRAKRVVAFAIDGITVSALEKASTPNIDALMADGAKSTTTRVVMPSVTLPNWTSQLTGSGPEQHGVVDNSWKSDKFILPAAETDAEGYYPSVFKVLKDNLKNVKTAFYYNWINLLYPYNQKYIDEISFLDDDAFAPNFDKAFSFVAANSNAPTFAFIYDGHTDNTAHRHSWASDEYIKAIEETDAEIGRFVERMKQAGLYDDTYFLVLSDHGGVGKGHGGVSTDEMIVPWGISGPSIKRGFTIIEPNNTVNTGSIILYLFGVKQPLVWTGEVIQSIFK